MAAMPRSAAPMSDLSRPSAARVVALTGALPDGPQGSLAERAYARLKAEIQEFALVPGDRFTEVEVGRRLGVSRTPVREALLRLRSEGFLDVESKTGWFVRPIDFGRIDALYDLRVILELASVARLCAQDVRSHPGIEALKAAWLVPAAERLDDARAVGALDEAFHTALVHATGNPEVARVHADVTDRIRIVRRLDFTRGDRIEATYAEHAKILRAVMQRKPDQARLLLASHIEQSKTEVRKITLHTLHQLRDERVQARAATAR